jgi:CTP:molybdopterin cytidylyltransferase MocA
MAETKVVILAAGRGTRMKAEVPKPLVKLAGNRGGDRQPAGGGGGAELARAV